MLHFFRLVDTLSPRTCDFLKENFKLGPSKRRVRKLNSRKASISPFECDFKTIMKNIIDETRMGLAPGRRLAFTLATYEKKVAG